MGKSQEFEDSKSKDKKECWKCLKEIDQKDLFCKFCGTKQGKKNKGSNLWGIIGQFLVIGPFCLISIWKSKNISKSKKKRYTYVILGVTLSLGLGLLYALSVIINYYSQILGI